MNLIGESGVLSTALDRAMALEIEIYQRAADPISSTTSRLENLSTAGKFQDYHQTTSVHPIVTDNNSLLQK